MASKVSRIVDLHVRIEPHHSVTRWVFPRTDETRFDAEARALREWAKEFMGFLRDHRSQDVVSVDVIEERDDLCSACGRKWEVSDEDGEGNKCAPFCANCGEEVDAVEATR